MKPVPAGWAQYLERDYTDTHRYYIPGRDLTADEVSFLMDNNLSYLRIPDMGTNATLKGVQIDIYFNCSQADAGKGYIISNNPMNIPHRGRKRY